MRQQSSKPIAALEALGFTALEASIYVDLLRSGPQTGYRIAQHVGKAPANTYNALEALAARGVVACEDGPTRLYRAVPYAEVSAKLAGDFNRRARDASDALRALERDEADDRVYRLHDAEQIFQRARALLKSAKSIAIVDAFPDTLEQLRDAIAAAGSRGVSVAVHAYAPAQIKDAHVVVAPNGAAVLKRWPGAWLSVSADGSTALVAHLLDDRNATGIWTENSHVAWTLYGGLASETALTALAEIAARNPSMPLDRALRSVQGIIPYDLPGRTALVSQMKKGNRR